MTLTPGARLGPYEILGALGAGGMGEVYKARDTRLDRTVAIKVLPSDLSSDPERRARFEREAKVIAALNHPHICVLHDVGEHQGGTFLVMEHLEGQTLAHRLRKGPLPVEQALEFATQIADALAGAHRRGIIHRDLKPANVMLTKDGGVRQGSPQVKLLDFGLAKLTAPAALAAPGLSALPTEGPATTPGVVLGTLPYLAPEQLEGKAADGRSDLFAFGCVLYEMLTGQRAFQGESEASVISAIMSSEPPSIAALRPLAPPAVDRLVRRCLAKMPDHRPDTAHDVAEDVRWLLETTGAELQPRTRSPRGRVIRAAALVAALLATAVAAAGVSRWLRGETAVTAAHLSLSVSPADSLNGPGRELSSIPTPGGSRTALAWTPDGKALVFVGYSGDRRQLYVRRLESPEAQPIKGTENGLMPAVSPDGQWLAFFAAGVIKKVPLGGGAVVELAATTRGPVGMAWSERGLFFADRADGRIWHIGVQGEPRAVSTLQEGEFRHILPHPLPGGRLLLYTVRNREWSWGDETIVAHNLENGRRRVVLTNAVDARYVSSGHLVFMRLGRLFAVPFDASTLEVVGNEMPLVDEVGHALAAASELNVSGAGQFDLSSAGTLAFIKGALAQPRAGTLVTVDRRGRVTPLASPPRGYGPVRVSPDGKRLAITVTELTANRLWVYDLARGSLLAPLPGDGEADWPVWERRGLEIYFSALEHGRRYIAVQRADGSGLPAAVARDVWVPVSVDPGGRFVAVVRGEEGFTEIGTVSVSGGTFAGLAGLVESRPRAPEISPDGRWLAYVAQTSGRSEIYVRPFPDAGPSHRVSVDGGTSPAWNPNGLELFFVSQGENGRLQMMAVDVAMGSQPAIGRPRRLFDFAPASMGIACSPSRCYDVAPDGQRFYATQLVPVSPQAPVTHINLITNWSAELKAKLPRQ